MLTRAEKHRLVQLLQEQSRREQRRRLFSYTPYPKQLEFHANGATERERLLMAGNQLGKTWSAGFECAMHLTGRYPKPGEIHYPTENEIADMAGKNPELAAAWDENLRVNGLYGADVYPNGWQGRRWNRPIWMWAASVSGEATRDNPQRILVGDPLLSEKWGTGAIPYEAIALPDGSFNVDLASQPRGALDAVRVRHVSGGFSLCQFKSYTQGRERWQGPTLDLVWFDEEPPLDIYMEGLTRTNATRGNTMITFTPLLGMSETVRLFISSEDQLTAA